MITWWKYSHQNHLIEWQSMTDIVSHLGNMVDIFMSSIQFLSKESSIILIIRSQKQNQTHFVHWTEFSHGAYIIMANSISPTFCYSLNWKSIANAILWHSITFFAIFFFWSLLVWFRFKCYKISLQQHLFTLLLITFHFRIRCTFASPCTFEYCQRIASNYLRINFHIIFNWMAHNSNQI